MATALPTPTGAQIIATLCKGDAAGTFGRWSALDIDNHETNSLVPVVGPEYDYAVALLEAAGYNPAALDDDIYAVAVKAMIHAIAYRLLLIDSTTIERFPGEDNAAKATTEANRQMREHWYAAGLAWLEIDIDSKYYRSPLAGMPDTVFVS